MAVVMEKRYIFPETLEFECISKKNNYECGLIRLCHFEFFAFDLQKQHCFHQQPPMNWPLSPIKQDTSFYLGYELVYHTDFAPSDYFLSQTWRNGSVERDLAQTIKLFLKETPILTTQILLFGTSQKNGESDTKCMELRWVYS